MSDTPPIKLYTALLTAMRDFGKVKKDRQNPAFRSSYATLHSILEAVEDPLHTQGLILVQRLVDDDGLALVTELIHAESGERISSYASVVCAEPNNPQKVGSAITYYRRYSLLTLLNLTPEEDDDGNAASQPIQRQQNGQRPNGQQRYDHARQHGKDPVTNDAPMWNDIEDAMAEDARRYAERLAKAPSSPQTNGSAPTRAPQPPTPQRPPQTRPQPLNAAPVGSPYDDAEYERLSRQVRTNDDALSPNEYNRYHELDRLRKEQFQAAKNAPQQATAVVAGPNPHPEGSVEYVLHEARAKAAGGMGWQQVWAYLSPFQRSLGDDWGAVVKESRAIKASIAG